MSKERQDIMEDFYSGDTKDIQFTVYQQDGVTLKDLSLSELTYALILDDAKNPRWLFQKSSVVSEITITGLGICVVHLLPSDTLSLYGTYRHQLHVYDENGYGGIVSSGKVQIFRSFARRLRSSTKHAYISA